MQRQYEFWEKSERRNDEQFRRDVPALSAELNSSFRVGWHWPTIHCLIEDRSRVPLICIRGLGSVTYSGEGIPCGRLRS